MPTDSEICIICEESPCQCRKASKKRRAPSASRLSRPSDAPRKTVRRVVGRGTSAEVPPPAQVEQPAADEPDQEEDAEFIYAVRLLAHLIDPKDPNLLALGDKILPSDRLPPEDRIADWKRRVGGS